jgi:hypothetical protein
MRVNAILRQLFSRRRHKEQRLRRLDVIVAASISQGKALSCLARNTASAGTDRLRKTTRHSRRSLNSADDQLVERHNGTGLEECPRIRLPADNASRLRLLVPLR